MRILLTMLVTGFLAMLPVAAVQAFDLEEEIRALQPQYDIGARPEFRVTQRDGMSLSEAIESVRRRTNGRIVSAETKVSGGRETHHIKVLTGDGKVKTHKVPGRRRGNR